MRREVPAPLSNEKVRYIEFQGDFWVTLCLAFLMLWNCTKKTRDINYQSRARLVISRIVCKVYAGHMFLTQHQLSIGMRVVQNQFKSYLQNS